MLCTQGAGGAAEDLMCELLACYSLDAMAGMCKNASQMPPGDSNPSVQDVLTMVVEDIQTPDNKARVPAVVRALGLRAAQTVYFALPAAIQPRILQVLGLASVPWLLLFYCTLYCKSGLVYSLQASLLLKWGQLGHSRGRAVRGCCVLPNIFMSMLKL